MDYSETPEHRSKNPSRHECEEQIRRILMTEVLRQGGNHHFRSAKDFMPLFDSLYPAGPGLTKQVQRAVKAMNMPKDKNGYFLVDKTKTQMAQDMEIGRLLNQSDFEIMELTSYETLFLKTDSRYRDYLLQLIDEAETLHEKFITAIPASNGILFLTENRALLKTLLESMIDRTA